MQPRRYPAVILLCALILLAACTQPRKRSYEHLFGEDAPVEKNDAPPQGTSFQLWLGVADYDDLTFQQESQVNPGVVAETEIDTMPFMGIAGQFPFVGQDLQAGMEGGFTIGAWGDRDKVYFSNNVLAVKLDSFLMLTDIFIGAFGALEVDESVRFYAGAGPLVMLGYYEYETEDAESTKATYAHIEDDELALGVGLYARAGVEFRVGKRGLLGVGARAVEADLDFGGDTGDVDIDGVQFMVTYGIGF